MSYHEEPQCPMEYEELLQRLREHAEWAEANIWEVPITMPDDIREAGQTIEALLLRQRLDPDQTAVCQAALDKYGLKSQTMMVMEEMAELQKELCKHLRGADNKAHIAEEIADVIIMLEQMILAHDIAGMVRIQLASKIHRLDKRLKDAKKEEKTCL